MLFLLRYSEIGLKSWKVRQKFEDLLIKDIRNAMMYYNIQNKIMKMEGRIIIEAGNEAINVLKKIGGVKSFSPVIITTSDLDEIRKVAIQYSSYISKEDTFAVRVRRIGNHNFRSIDVARAVGDDIRKKRKAKVDLSNPSKKIFIEIRQKISFIYNEVLKGIGGLPYGCQGKILGIVKNDRDIEASWLMVRRGCHVDFVSTPDMKDKINEMMEWREYKIYFDKDIEKIVMKTKAKGIVGYARFVKKSVPVFYPLLGKEFIDAII